MSDGFYTVLYGAIGTLVFGAVGILLGLLLTGCTPKTLECRDDYIQASYLGCEALYVVHEECGFDGLWETGVTPKQVDEIIALCWGEALR